jgi:hypothetical protein
MATFSVTLVGDIADLANLPPEVLNLLNRVVGAAPPRPMPPPGTEPEPAPPSLAAVYRFRHLNVIDLPAELARPFMAGLGSSTQVALRRVIDGGSPEFNARDLLAAPGQPESYATTHTAITRRLRTVTRNPDARLFGWSDPGTGMWAMSEATFDALKQYFESNAG